MEIIIQIVVTVVALFISILIKKPLVVEITLGIALVLNLMISIISHRKRENKLDELIMYLMKVQDNLELPPLNSMTEGRISILQSEIYKLVVQLKEMYSEEKKQKKYMVDMLSDISHQIKTPMTAITIMTELLGAPELTDEKRLDYVGKINQQTKRITWLVRNLLTLSQLEADMLELKLEKVNLKEMLEDIVETFEIMSEVKGVEMNLKCPAEVFINCDKQWTREAISNIVKNCIEHTGEGGQVSINAIWNNLATEIVVSDTGEGIPKEHLPNIFKRFYKAPGSSSSSVGIGLAMSKQIIMRQNGNITVESEVGKGSKFFIKMYP